MQTILVIPYNFKKKYKIKSILAAIKADDMDTFLSLKENLMGVTGYSRRTWEKKINAGLYDKEGFNDRMLTKIAKILKLKKGQLMNYDPDWVNPENTPAESSIST